MFIQIFSFCAGTLRRLGATIIQHHPLLVNFSRQRSVHMDRWMALLYQISGATSIFFIVAFILSIGHPGDNGQCIALITKTACLGKASPLIVAQQCQWVANVGLGESHNQCIYRGVKADPFCMIVLNVVILYILIPIQAVFNNVFRPLIFAPVKSVVAKRSFPSPPPILEEAQTGVAIKIKDRVEFFQLVEHFPAHVTSTRSLICNSMNSSRQNIVAMENVRRNQEMRRPLNFSKEALTAQLLRQRVMISDPHLLDEFDATWFVPNYNKPSSSWSLHPNIEAKVWRATKQSTIFSDRVKELPLETVGPEMLKLFFVDILGAGTWVKPAYWRRRGS